MLNQYRSTSGQTRKTLEDLEAIFATNNALTQQELNDMSIHMLRLKKYDDGRLTYINYFRQYLNLSINTFRYWLTHVSVDSISDFVTNYCDQMKTISRQIRWSFSTMTDTAYAFDTGQKPVQFSRVPFIGMDLSEVATIGWTFVEFLEFLRNK